VPEQKIITESKRVLIPYFILFILDFPDQLLKVADIVLL